MSRNKENKKDERQKIPASPEFIQRLRKIQFNYTKAGRKPPTYQDILESALNLLPEFQDEDAELTSTIMRWIKNPPKPIDAQMVALVKRMARGEI